ncbi:MAG TPA: thioredoxin [Acidimicrobiales bacterium]|nr:thioredoxin [Acidimicrobiales bacterium]
MTAVTDLTATAFDETVLGSPVPVLVDFWAEWCPPCHALAPILDEIAAEHADRLRIYKLDVDQQPEVALRYDVMSFPTLLVFVDGQPVQRLIGARGKHHLLAELAEVLDA